MLRGRLEAEMEVLVKERRGERGCEVEVDDRRRLVPREHRAHHALVEELEERGARHAALLGEHSDLGERLGDDAEHQVVADLHEAGHVAPAHVGRSGPEELEVRTRGLPGIGRPRHDDRQLAGIDHRRVPADGRREQRDVATLRLGPDLGGRLGRDRRRVHDHRRRGVGARQQPVLAEHDGLEVLRSGDHREDDLAIGQLGRRVHDLRAQLSQRLGLRARAVVDSQVAARVEQAGRERVPHPARPHPTERLAPQFRVPHCCKRLHRLGGRVKHGEVDGHARAVQSFAALDRARWRNGIAHVRDDGRGLGGARALRPAARGAARADLVAARRVGNGRPALLRHDEHPLHHGNPHRHLGPGQAESLLPPPPARRADHVGLRLRGPPPPALQPVAGRRPLPRRHLHAPRRDVAGVEPAVLFALQKAGVQVVDGQQLMQEARMIKTRDEITLLNTACMMVDAAYEELYRTMRPGMRENECVALVNKVLYDMGSEFVEGVNAISGERCSPHPHVYTDRALRPGDPAYFDILHSFMGYRTCYYRTFAVGSASRSLIDAYKRCRYYLDAAIELIRPGVSTADVVKVWPRAEEFGFPDEEAAFALQFGHGVGLAIWEKPIFSRLVSLDHPEEIEEGMVFALETFWPASDGWSAARIEEQLVVTADGCEVITRFPAEDLVIAGRPYYTTGGSLPLERETQSNLNTRLDSDAQEAAPAADGARPNGAARLPLPHAGATP